MTLRTREFYGLSIADVSWQGWTDYLTELLSHQQTFIQVVMTPNPEQIMLARRQRCFYHDLAQADILLPDGLKEITGLHQK